MVQARDELVLTLRQCFDSGRPTVFGWEDMLASEPVQHMAGIHTDNDVLQDYVLSQLGICSDRHQRDPEFLQVVEYDSSDSFVQGFDIPLDNELGAS